MRLVSHTFLTAILCVTLFVGCGDSGGGGTPGASASANYAADASGLKALMTDLRAAMIGGDESTAAALTHALFPTEAEIASALRPGNEPVAGKVYAMHGRYRPADDAAAARVFQTPADRSEVLVHASSTAALAAYAKGTPAFMEFPGGSRALAKQVLREDLTVYEVEFVVPGESSGTKYHLFWNDGAGWRMLGKAWRALR